jgi:hypothetical protein
LVIARNSSFTYKGQAIDVKRVGRELGVRYVLELTGVSGVVVKYREDSRFRAAGNVGIGQQRFGSLDSVPTRLCSAQNF